MITLEALLLFRVAPKPELFASVKRAAEAILNRDGVVRKLENLGTRDTPFKISQHGLVHRKASYFLIEFNVPTAKLEELKDELGRDIDIIRRRVYKQVELKPTECTLHEELQPPPYRKDVQELIEQSRKLDKPKFNYNTGLNYYPFQK